MADSKPPLPDQEKGKTTLRPLQSHEPVGDQDRDSRQENGTNGATGTTGVRSWIDERLGLSGLGYPVPLHANTFWYTLGGITFIGITVLAITGVWLGQYYNPDPAAARESVIFIQDEVPLGGLVRGIHAWTAYLVVITALLHLGRIFITASYKIPREVNWLIGLGLLGLLVFGAVFTGTVLKWDQEAFEALEHNMELAGLVGAIGGFFTTGFTSSVAILARLYIAHVSIAPLLLILLLIPHFLLVKYHGISPTPAQADAGLAPRGKLPHSLMTSRYTTHLRFMATYGLSLLGIAAVLAVILPQPIGPAPDPTMEVTKPPFIFYWLYAFEDWFGVSGILYATIGFAGIMVLIPLLDRIPARRLRRRPAMLALGSVLLVIILGLTLLVAFSPVARHLGE